MVKESLWKGLMWCEMSSDLDQRDSMGKGRESCEETVGDRSKRYCINVLVN